MLLRGQERRKGQIGKIPGQSLDKSGKNPGKIGKKDKKGQTTHKKRRKIRQERTKEDKKGQNGKEKTGRTSPYWEAPRLPALEQSMESLVKRCEHGSSLAKHDASIPYSKFCQRGRHTNCKLGILIEKVCSNGIQGKSLRWPSGVIHPHRDGDLLFLLTTEPQNPTPLSFGYHSPRKISQLIRNISDRAMVKK